MDKNTTPQSKPHVITSTGNLSASSAGSGDKGSTDSMRVKVYSPSKVYFDEIAASISAESPTGPFDILPQHHNFITLLMPCELDIQRTGHQDHQRIKISGGVMHVRASHVTVFLDV